jgi:hypothetical protein
MERAKLAGIEGRITELTINCTNTPTNGTVNGVASLAVGIAALAMDDSAESDTSESVEEEPLSLLQVNIYL